MPPDVSTKNPAAPPILIIGPFPPPVHGFAAITLAMSQEVAKVRPVIRCDLTSAKKNPVLRHLEQIGRFFRAMGRIIVFRLQGGRDVSLGVNGGWGLVYTLGLAATVRGTGMRLCVHHHSYAYINERFRLMDALCSLGGPALEHVFLAHSMREAFFARYPETMTSHVLPNAVFVPAGELEAPRDQTRIAVGLLSNLGREKGLYDFIDVARQIRLAGLPVDMLLAGPAPRPEDAAAIAAAQQAGLLKSFGPLYATQKAEFFRSLDLFLFPTRHVDEAQPTVVYEAFSNGVPVLAYARGAIVEQVGESFGSVPVDQDFAVAALACCSRLISMDAEKRAGERHKARQRHADETVEGRAALEALYGR